MGKVQKKERPREKKSTRDKERMMLSQFNCWQCEIDANNNVNYIDDNSSNELSLLLRR